MTGRLYSIDGARSSKLLRISDDELAALLLATSRQRYAEGFADGQRAASPRGRSRASLRLVQAGEGTSGGAA